MFRHNHRSPSQPEENNLIGLLRVLGCENPHRSGDIIFVHGLAGHPWSTWHPQNQKDRQDVNFWPYWLGEELEQSGIDVGIWSFGYEAARFQFSGWAMARFDLASNLLEYLEVNDIGKRPLIFVTHSMGGLLVKEAIRTAQNFRSRKIFIEQTKWIVFLSTPHTGAHIASLIDKISYLVRPNVNVKELKANEQELLRLNEWYRQNVENLAINTKVFYETRRIYGILVVDEGSANPGIRDVQPIAVPFDHNSIAKPQINDLVYLSVKKICCQAFTASTPEESQLKFLGFEQSPELNYPPFLGREEDIKKLKEQIIERKCKVISLWGQQGIGKSYLAKKLTEEQEIVDGFDYIIWTKLLFYQPLQHFLDNKIFHKLPILDTSSPSDEHGIPDLIKLLNRHKILIIIDGLEQLEESDEDIYKKYLQMLNEVKDSTHKSCLLVISHKKEINKLEITNSHDYKLKGLVGDALINFIKYIKIEWLSEEHLKGLEKKYGGNPKRLEEIAIYIDEFFDRDPKVFLGKTTKVTSKTRGFLDKQVKNKNFSLTKRAICNWLAIYGIPVKSFELEEKVRNSFPFVTGDDFYEALQSLKNGLIIEKVEAGFFLPPEHRRYFINRIINKLIDEISNFTKSSNLENTLLDINPGANCILIRYRLLLTNYLDKQLEQAQKKRIIGGLIKRLSRDEEMTKEKLWKLHSEVENFDKINRSLSYLSDNIVMLVEN
ncbi:NB-ARC domain-containing protein [Moorena sp. SIO4G3]|uniref:NB-ARC domain-containing protein n=1 Tax=Moorena sp. SIO4G3 TaxID=2607821 RepID=UPI00142C0595|nr:NB-ARC domain-containing protein [Moorena sp. SIO4G3]NEO81018.1 NACHT domain-containing protein [Moorena sp. SIO4G3]